MKENGDIDLIDEKYKSNVVKLKVEITSKYRVVCKRCKTTRHINDAGKLKGHIEKNQKTNKSQCDIYFETPSKLEKSVNQTKTNIDKSIPVT